MSHLTDEQFESILSGQSQDNDHLLHCPDCQARLQEKQALSNRLAAAFNQITAPDALAQNIRNQRATQSQTNPTETKIVRLSGHWKRWAASFSSIAAIAVLVVLLRFTLVPSPVYADLIDLHQHVSVHHGLMAISDPNDLAAHLCHDLGFTPSSLSSDRKIVLPPCCRSFFKGDIQSHLAVKTDQGVISVAVIPNAPTELGLKPIPCDCGCSGTCYCSESAHCNMVAMPINDVTCYIMGNVSSDYLHELILQLMAYHADH